MGKPSKLKSLLFYVGYFADNGLVNLVDSVSIAHNGKLYLNRSPLKTLLILTEVNIFI